MIFLRWLLLVVALAGGVAHAATVEQWGSTEIALNGPSEGNPFVEVSLSATFRQGQRSLTVPGFYDGEGRYLLRFMPDAIGDWDYVTHSNRKELDGHSGRIAAVAPRAGNHGPVRVHNTFHFAYADGTPFWQVGTTSYAWTHQGEALARQTLATLAASPFNKLRMGLFPKRYTYNRNEPPLYPFEGKAPAQWDFQRFNPAFFRDFERRIAQLRAMGIEADIILFHPYDKGHWGFDRMPPEADERYLRYVVARLASYRNVWWSLANEFDFMKEKTVQDWDRLFQVVQASDPYQHLRSIHNGFAFYDHGKPWVTHVSVQSGTLTEDFERAVLLRDVYNKPVVYDEVKYEGNFPQRWGNLTPQQMVLRFWQGAIAGTYVGHSETYLSPDEVVWWSKGGALHGQSPARLAFFRNILAESPAAGLEPIDKWQNQPMAGKPGQYYLAYFGQQAPASWPVVLPKAGLADGMRFRAEVIDTWNMTVTPVGREFELRKRDAYSFADKDGGAIAMPGRPHMALRLTRVGQGADCAGEAAWCRDFEQGAGNWQAPRGDYAVRDDGAGKHLLRAAPGSAMLVPDSETAAAMTRPYYVEARMRAPTSPGQGFVLARYADEDNWLGFGLELARDGRKLSANIVQMVGGRLEYLKQVRVEPDPAGSFYTLRLDVDGRSLTLHFNGTRMIGTDEGALLPARSGVRTLGASMEVDDLRIGDATRGPVSLGLARMRKTLNLQAGEAAQPYVVRAAGRGGLRAMRFDAESGNPAVAQVRVEGDKLLVMPRAAGEAAIVVRAAQDDNIALNLTVRVAPPFVASVAKVALQGRVSPAPGEREVPVDTPLRLTLDQAPALAPGAVVRIVRAADGVTVDTVRAGEEIDVIGAAPDGVRRVVRYRAITADGAALAIRPHDGRLAYDTEYRVLVDGGLAPGATLAGRRFDGIGPQAGWTFRTRARAPQGASLRVAGGGKADFRTVQGALNHAMGLPRAQPVTIDLADGRYEGLLYLRGKDNVTLRGASRAGTVVAGENSDGVNPGSGSGQSALAPGATGGRSVLLVEDADLLRLERLTLTNTTWRSKTIGAQAEALYFSSEGRFIANEVDFLSEQDTVQVKGYAWFYRSLIAGNVDFIWGYNRATLFEESEIRSVGDSANPASGGYLVQARTVAENDPGFVFLRSRLTHGAGPAGNDVPPGATYLARPGIAAAWDKVHFIDCRMDRHIAAQGWSGRPRNDQGWTESGSMDLDGAPLDLSARRSVSGDRAPVRYESRAAVFAQFNNGQGWNPQP